MEVRTAEGFMSDVVWIELTVELTVVTRVGGCVAGEAQRAVEDLQI